MFVNGENDGFQGVRSPTLISGKYYVHASPGAQTPITLNNNRVRVSPFFVTTPIAISRIGCSVSIAGNAGAVFRIGLWNDTNGRPATLARDFGTALVDTTGGKEITLGANYTIQPGLYWVGGVPQNAATTAPTLHCINPGSINGPISWDSLGTLSGDIETGYYMDGVSGALTNFTVPTDGQSTNSARIIYRVA